MYGEGLTPFRSLPGHLKIHRTFPLLFLDIKICIKNSKHYLQSLFLFQMMFFAQRDVSIPYVPWVSVFLIMYQWSYHWSKLFSTELFDFIYTGFHCLAWQPPMQHLGHVWSWWSDVGPAVINKPHTLRRHPSTFVVYFLLAEFSLGTTWKQA